MKKSLVYMGILVFLFGSAMSIAGEIDWDEYFEDPCTHERLDSVLYELGIPPEEIWGQAKVDTICSVDIPGNPCPGCCFYLVYHELYNPGGLHPSGTKNLFISVRGVRISSSDCEGCINNDELIQLFYERKINEYTEMYPNLFGELTNYLEYDSTGMFTFPVFTIGNCYTNDDGDCGKACCHHKVYAYFDTTGYKLDSLVWDDSAVDSDGCDSATCEADCYEIDVIDDLDLYELDSLCRFPCDEGEWESDSTELETVPNCPACSYKVFYSTREGSGDCNGYIDIVLDSVRFEGVCNCAIQMHAVMKEAVGIVLRDVVGYDLDIGECKDKIRVATGSCWAYVYSLDVPPEKIGLHQCEIESCCWARYEICRINEQEFSREYIDGSMSDTDTCHVYHQLCEMICGDLSFEGIDTVTMSRNLDYEYEYSGDGKSWAVPNPTNGLVDIHVESSEIGEISIAISDLNGRELIRRSGVKEGAFFNEKFDLNKFHSGLYFYQVYISGRLLFNGKISLNK